MTDLRRLSDSLRLSTQGWPGRTEICDFCPDCNETVTALIELVHAAYQVNKMRDSKVQGFLQTLKTQRWDDHRYYHHSRINQALHLVSALSFLAAYVALFTNPVAAALIAWLVAMTSRQAGHFFFEPKGYDIVNQATHEHKEANKVGYNLERNV